jgi:hypothetical protein
MTFTAALIGNPQTFSGSGQTGSVEIGDTVESVDVGTNGGANGKSAQEPWSGSMATTSVALSLVSMIVVLVGYACGGAKKVKVPASVGIFSARLLSLNSWIAYLRNVPVGTPSITMGATVEHPATVVVNGSACVGIGMETIRTASSRT